MSFHYVLTSIATFLIFSLGFFVLQKNSKSKITQSFCLMCFSAFIWLFFVSISYNHILRSYAELLLRISYVGVNFISITTFHFTIEFLKKNNLRNYVKFVYAYGSVCALIILKTKYIISGIYTYYWGFYPKAGKFHPLFLLFFVILISICLVLLTLSSLKEVRLSIRRRQINYILLSIFVFNFASVDFIPNYGIEFYPFGYIPTTLLVFIISYAILKYQILDIKIAVTRVGLFVIVYTLILGIPFWLGIKLFGQGLWLLPTGVCAILATICPFIYLYIQRRTEEQLLQEQRRYQATLRQASTGMGRIKDLKKLLNMIVYVLTHAIQIEHASIYIYSEDQKQYVLGASKRKFGYSHFNQDIQKDSLLIKYLLENKNLVIFDEIKQKAQDYKDELLTKIEQIIVTLEGALVVPIFIDQGITAIIVMGKKESGKSYTEDDLGVFSILANQTALAIENAKFYEDMKSTHEQLFQAEKMATIGTMADGLSHQINNRFHALGFIAGDALDTIRLNQKEQTPEKKKEVMAELDRALVRIQENVVQGGEIVQGLLKYTRKGEIGFTAVDIESVLKSAIEMVQFKIKIQELKIVRDYDLATIPKIKGNFTQLQEVFFNLIDNGYDAMMQRKNEAKEASYQPTLIVHVFKEDNYAQIIFEDNGMGVKDDDLHKLFTPFFTTKLSSKKGTGLGLYVIKKIVEDNHNGKVEMVSKYMQGTQMKLRLPIAIG